MGANKSPIEHLVVLMLENRSYDYMLGYLPNGRGLTGREYNRINTADPKSEKVYVSNSSGYFPLPAPLMLTMIGLTALYVVATELTKKFFYSRGKNAII